MSTRFLYCENCDTTTLQTLVRSESIGGKAWECADCLVVSESSQTTLGGST